MVQDERLPLLHQFQPKFLRVLQTEWKINIFKDMVLQLDRKAGYLLILLRPRQIPPPLLLLAGHMCSANHLDIGVDEEECDDLAMAGLGWVSKLERADAVLKNVRESEQAAFASLDAANLLHSWAFVLAPEHLEEPFMVVLWVTNINGFFFIYKLAEGER
jgi:hypothetical protein